MDLFFLSGGIRNPLTTGLDLPFPLLPPSLLEVLFDLEDGNESHSVCRRVWDDKKQA